MLWLFAGAFSAPLPAQKPPEAAQPTSAGWKPYVQSPEEGYVGKDRCRSCHKAETLEFARTVHGRVSVESTGAVIGCETCHGPGRAHAEAVEAAGGDDAKIAVAVKQYPLDPSGACLSCHAQDEKVRNWLAGSHAANRVRCADCHEIHIQPQPVTQPRVSFNTTTPSRVALVEKFVPEYSRTLEPRWATNDTCLRCHAAERAQMSLPYHHPLREGKMSCVDCHDPHGGTAGNNLRTANVNQLCLSCHAQYRGPFMYQHPPVNESCLICHSPHGSPNSSLLSVSLPALCLQCHAGHHDGAGLPLVDRCTNCHGSIHGSDVPTPTGGSRFVDKGGLGVAGSPQSFRMTRLRAQPRVWGGLAPVPAHAATTSPASPSPSAGAAWSSGGWQTAYPSLAASHPPVAFAPMAPVAGLPGAMSWALPGGMAAGAALPSSGAMGPDTYWGMYFTPAAYRFLNVTGYGGRVGEYDSLQEAEGGDFEEDYVSIPHHLSLITRGTVLTGSDFDVASRFSLGQRLEVGGNMRSFVEQQDNYPFLSSSPLISPDITVTDAIPPGAVFGVKRRMGDAYARLKVPTLPVHLFVRGSWQARVGQTQLSFLDENINNNCGETCHHTSQLQQLNYTTRDIGGGVEVNRGGMDLTYEHDFSSFNDRLPYPSATFGPMLNEFEPGPVFVPDTPAGTYFFDIPASSQYSADLLSLNWTVSPQIVFNGQVTYRRSRDVFTRNPQNGFDSATTLLWHTLDRLRLTADYRQQNLVNDFTPFFPLYGNMSYHEHWAGVKADYELSDHFDIEAHYRRSGISRSNAFLWPQIYSFDNTDLLTVVPTSSANTTGLALRYHGEGGWQARAGYEWTGTHNPGYLLDPKSNSRIFGNLTLAPKRWLIFTNDTSIIVQNAFPLIQRRNRFYADTADAAFTLVPNWSLGLGYSYQQNNLGTYAAFQNDAAAGYVVDEPFVLYRQLSQAYWVRSGYTFRQKLGLNLTFEHNSAHSGMLPDVNPNDFLLMGNGPLVEQGTFDPGVFQQALGALALGSTLGSQVNVPQLIGQGKLYYLLPHGFDTGLLFYYDSYRDFTNPNLNGILRVYSVYFGRSW